MDFNLKADYAKLEEVFISLSTLLEKPDQDIIAQMIKDLHATIETFQKTKSYYLFNRDNEKVFNTIRKIKQSLTDQEKLKNKDQPKVEKKGEVK